jgi:acetyl esterase/lipase
MTPSIRTLSSLLRSIAACGTLLLTFPCRAAALPEEKPLWPETGWQNPIHYDVAEAVQEHAPGEGSLSGRNRVCSFVSVPAYSLHEAAPDIANGVGLVICPGGGFRELWIDREGHDLALWLKARGVTSLVLKYRTNTEVDGKRKYNAEVYEQAVIADAGQAIRILRSQASALHLDPHRIGICGFSAGGALSAYSIFHVQPPTDASQVNGQPDFAGLFYPGLRDISLESVAGAKNIPPLFIVNASDDRLTPVDRCVDFYQSLLKAGAHAELHVFSKGGHGFDMGDGHGQSVALWKESFWAWLKDAGFISAGVNSAKR